MTWHWPAGFARVPDEDWTRHPVETLALKYDNVEQHGWYANLDPTVDELAAEVGDGHVIVDYSGGTGILIGRLLAALPHRSFGIVNVDSSPKFLRLSLEKFRNEPRVAFRLIRYQKEPKRLQFVDEVLGPDLVRRGVDAIVSTNAIHLYYELPATLASWARVVRPGGRAFVQSGNIGRPEPRAGTWIIDETVDAIQLASENIVREEERYAQYRAVLGRPATMAAYAALRKKYFLPVRPLEHYVRALESAGFAVERVVHRPIGAVTREWHEFLSVYHEGVLGWVGGTEKVEGHAPADAAVRDRLDIIRAAMDRIFGGRATFEAEWTYLTCRRQD